MKLRLMDLLRCPRCLTPLKLEIFDQYQVKPEEVHKGVRCTSFCAHLGTSLGEVSEAHVPCEICYETEIRDGVLLCECGAIYPVYQGVPRLCLDSLQEQQTYRSRYHLELKFYLQERNEVDLGQTVVSEKRTQRSFSLEWYFFDYSDRTWGWTVEERKTLFLEDLHLEAQSLKGRLLLDAGCGNGALTAALTDFGLETVGIDLSDSVERGAVQNDRAYTHFVQASVMTPPFKRRSFDLVFSSGVLHHTPDTRAAFRSIAELCVDGGRTYIWVYHREKGARYRVADAVRSVVNHMPSLLQHLFCLGLIPLYIAKDQVREKLGGKAAPNYNWEEYAVAIMDTYTPEFRFAHTPDEVMNWFREAGFEYVVHSSTNERGFGVFGDFRPLSETK